MIGPAHPDVTVLRVIVGGLSQDEGEASATRERLYVALSAAQAWLEDAEIQVHNSRSILQRLAESESGIELDHEAGGWLCRRVDTIAAEVCGTLDAVEQVIVERCSVGSG